MSDAPLTLALGPDGSLSLEPGDAETPPLPPALRRRVEAAFARGWAKGLLELGAAEPTAELPPVFAFARDVARLFVAEVCKACGPGDEAPPGPVEPPPGELERLALSAPPLPGAELLSEERLRATWGALEAALRGELAARGGGVEAFLREKSPLWQSVGRVWFHLAENKHDEGRPFAFLATFTTRVGQGGRLGHAPLGRALEAYAGAGERHKLLSLLVPIQRAAEASPVVRGLVDSGDIYQPLAWTPEQAYAFLRELPACEAAGVALRVPPWFEGRRPPRPTLKVKVGKAPPSALGAEGLLDFAAELTLEGEVLSEHERRDILNASAGLALVRGKWVEVDGPKLRAALERWQAVAEAAKSGGVSFVEAMRMVAGVDAPAAGGEELAGPAAGWAEVVAGDWLAGVIAELRSPEGLKGADPGEALRATLRPYQREGVRWLWHLYRLNLGGCLADDMGLGKTVQMIALLLLARKARERGPHLLVVPASLVANWKAELERFAPSLSVLIAHPSAMPAAELAERPAGLEAFDAVVTTYGTLLRVGWLAGVAWGVVVADEAQAIKNPGAKQTRALKALKARARFALTGTPVENRLGDLWSIFDFALPGLLGSAKAFAALERRLGGGERPDYGPLRALVRPYVLRRLKSDKRVLDDLPAKTEVRAYCPLTKAQAALYEQAVRQLARDLDRAEGMARRGAILAALTRMKQICNHPSQWLGDADYDPAKSGKMQRLRELGEAVAARRERALVFTQFREMTGPLAAFLQAVFGRPGLVLHGGTPVKRRQALVDEFQAERGPPFFVISLKAGGTGLNLTAASHVIHFDRWWNPAVENQATDRAHRIGQKNPVLVHAFVCRGTVEEKIDALLEQKRGLARQIVDEGGEAWLTELGDRELLELVTLDARRALEGG
ncbi:MAG TPA: DEAD/DEAH box helicase [Polyangiaceae bacterium]|nr:DEAD/DEAH box helicase [Polyangiaceae bacterium]